MKEIKDYKTLLDTISTAVLIAEPFFDETGRFTDFGIIYENCSFRELTQDKLPLNGKFSEFKEDLTKDIDWFEMAFTCVREKRVVEKIFWSDLFGIWVHAVFNCVLDDFAALTLTDVTQIKNYETSLAEQNKNLEAVTGELAASQKNLNLQLRNIQALNEQLLFAAYHDTLTNLYNRTWLTNAIKEEISLCNDKNSKFGIIFVNIDNMKDINDSRGHHSGDDMIRQCAAIFRMLESKNVVATRFGGDEFVLLCKNIKSKQDVIYLGKKTLSFFNAEGIGISGGISIFPDDSRDSEDLIKFADMAKSDVKKNGKNGMICFHSVMQEKFLNKLQIETKLTKATADKLFQLYYQPQFDTITDELRGFEALLRWYDDELGWISPEQFIPLAEETKLVIPIGDWVMQTAIDTLANWEKVFNFDGVISVNVSPIQFNQDDFMKKFVRRIINSGINPKHLEVEITEGIFIDNVDEIVKKLKEIRDMGIGISLDDFGTGYSSLRYLQMLPLTTLKIDKSFISNIEDQSGMEANITETIISLVSRMGWDTIAEGVENEKQLELLKKINCRTVQGFLRGKPMPRALCEQLLSGNTQATLTNKNS